MTVDLERFEELEYEAKLRSRSVHKTVQQIVSENLFADFVAKNGASTFVGYTEMSTNAKILGLVKEGHL